MMMTLAKAELSGDNKEVYLFQWLANVSKYIKEVQIVCLLRCYRRAYTHIVLWVTAW